MLSCKALRQLPSLLTPRLRLDALGPAHLEVSWAALADPEALRLTGRHARFTREGVLAHLAGLATRDDRAIVRRSDGAYLGEVVLNELDPHNLAMNFRILWSRRPGGRATAPRPPASP